MLKVYDSKNTERFLGVVRYDRALSPRSSTISIAVMSQANYIKMRDDDPYSHKNTVAHVDFKMERKSNTEVISSSHYEETRVIREFTVLMTSAPLSDLMRIREFIVGCNTEAEAGEHCFFCGCIQTHVNGSPF